MSKIYVPVGSNFQSIDSTDDYSASESMEKSIQPSNQEVQEVLQQLSLFCYYRESIIRKKAVNSKKEGWLRRADSQ